MKSKTKLDSTEGNSNDFISSSPSSKNVTDSNNSEVHSGHEDGVIPGNKGNARDRCEEYHLALMNCKNNESFLNFNFCIKESKQFWDCIDHYLGKDKKKAKSRDYLPKPIADIDEKLKHSVLNALGLGYFAGPPDFTHDDAKTEKGLDK